MWIRVTGARCKTQCDTKAERKQFDCWLNQTTACPNFCLLSMSPLCTGCLFYDSQPSFFSRVHEIEGRKSRGVETRAGQKLTMRRAEEPMRLHSSRGAARRRSPRLRQPRSEMHLPLFLDDTEGTSLAANMASGWFFEEPLAVMLKFLPLPRLYLVCLHVCNPCRCAASPRQEVIKMWLWGFDIFSQFQRKTSELKANLNVWTYTLLQIIISSWNEICVFEPMDDKSSTHTYAGLLGVCLCAAPGFRFLFFVLEICSDLMKTASSGKKWHNKSKIYICTAGAMPAMALGLAFWLFSTMDSAGGHFNCL